MRLVMNLWVLAAFSEVFADALLAWAFWRQRHTSWVGWYWSAVVAGCFLESVCAVIALLSDPSPPPASGWNILRMLGRTAQAAGLWAMALKVLRQQPKLRRI
jgi:hypothetical protein